MYFRYGRQKDFFAIRDLWIQGFGDDVPAYNDWYFRCVYRPERTICCIEQERIVSCLQLAPYTLFLDKQQFPIAYLVGVVTDKAFQHQGFGHALLRYTFGQLAAAQYKLAMLYTDIPEFYTPVGFAHCYAHKEIFLFPEQKQTPIMQWEKISPTARNLQKCGVIYRHMTAQMNGYVLRTEDNWRTFMGDYFNAGGGLWLSKEAYFAWTPENGEFIVREIGYTSEKALQDALIQIRCLMAQTGYPRAKWTAPLCAPYTDGRDKQVPFAMCRRLDIPDNCPGPEAAEAVKTLFQATPQQNWVNEMT